MRHRRQPWKAKPFNRTKLELKLGEGRQAQAQGRAAFNRTKLELKLLSRSDLYQKPGTFNRTKLELKHSKCRRRCSEASPLIEPSWN